MLGIILVSKGLHSSREVVLGYPNSVFKEDFSYFDSVHYNNLISPIKGNGKTERKDFLLGWPSSVIAQLLCPKQERWNTLLDFSAESFRFIGYPVSVYEKTKTKKFTGSKNSFSFLSLDSETSLKVKENLSAFNVVLAFDVDSQLLANIESIKEAVIAISKILIRSDFEV